MLDLLDHGGGPTSPEPLPDTAAGNAERERLCRLFRHSLLAGQVHPLLHVMQRHGDVQGGLQVSRSTVASASVPVASARIDAAVLHQRIIQLPSLPQAVLDVMRLLGHEDARTADIADCIERDQALMARTLRIANSAFYG